MLEKPLVFPEDKKISKKLKDLMTKMMIIDVTRRIGWDELFEHELLATRLDPEYVAELDKMRE